MSQRTPVIHHCHACRNTRSGYITTDCCTCCEVPPYAIQCPRCDAEPGSPCRTPGGGYYDHKARAEHADELTRKARR